MCKDSRIHLAADHPSKIAASCPTSPTWDDSSVTTCDFQASTITVAKVKPISNEALPYGGKAQNAKHRLPTAKLFGITLNGTGPLSQWTCSSSACIQLKTTRAAQFDKGCPLTLESLLFGSCLRWFPLYTSKPLPPGM